LIVDGAIDCPLHLNYTEAVSCEDDFDPMYLPTDDETPMETNWIGAETNWIDAVQEDTDSSSGWNLVPWTCFSILIVVLTLSIPYCDIPDSRCHLTL
jgi:hypothetical protein